ncbi:hypothetical protein [Anaerocolumna jejuensis]|uniref:hypothetical protein n=1 Tax=Anaerocolumna jejuensis TaxID=259063 RepID=UPI003F7C8E6F
MSEQTINDLHIVLDNIDSRIEKSAGNNEELQYLTYQKIKILQLIDDFNQRKEFFVNY